MTYTGATAIQAGQVFVLYFDGSFDITATQALNPDWQIIKYGTGSLNISVVGDQLFFLQGGTWENAVPSAHNATYTGGRAIYAFDTNPTWESLAGNSNKSGLPEFARYGAPATICCSPVYGLCRPDISNRQGDLVAEAVQYLQLDDIHVMFIV